MADPWTPEHPVDRELAAELLREQFPEVPTDDLRSLGSGWDNDVWEAGDLVFRFPRRAIAVPLVETELRVLPEIAPRLPLPVPRPVAAGRPSPRFPAPWIGYRMLPGRTVDRARIGPDDRARLAPALGAFLRALHGIGAEEGRRLRVPDDTFRGDLSRAGRRALEFLPRLEGTAGDGLLPVARGALSDPPEDAPADRWTVIHGDLHPRHVLLDENHGAAGVIDWGDLCLGDAALDLSLAYTLLPAPARDAFFAAYGPVDEKTRRRARFFGLGRYGVQLQVYARDVGDQSLVRESERSLRNALDAR